MDPDAAGPAVLTCRLVALGGAAVRGARTSSWWSPIGLVARGVNPPLAYPLGVAEGDGVEWGEKVLTRKLYGGF